MINNNSDRLNRIEQNLEHATQLLERIIATQQTQQQQIQTLLDAAVRHEVRITRQNVLIKKFDTILKHLVRRENYRDTKQEV